MITMRQPHGSHRAIKALRNTIQSNRDHPVGITLRETDASRSRTLQREDDVEERLVAA